MNTRERFLRAFTVQNVQVFLLHNHLYCAPKPGKTSQYLITSQRAIMYFKTSKQELFGIKLGCNLHYFQYQMRCYGCIFKFLNTKIRENAPYINFMYQVSTFYREKSLSNQKVHLRLLKSNFTFSILKLPWKKFQ